LIERAPQLDSAQQGRLIDLLRSLPRGDSVCHCDFHSENVLAGKSGVAVVDWIAATCGNPLADVARTYVLHVAYDKPTGAFGRPISRLLRKLFLNAYMKSYFGGQSQPNHEELERWIAVVAAAKLGDRGVSQTATLMTLVERGLGRIAVDRPAVPRS
jgi:aminoglycoside phosphotransferase (APT) family kinase protein